MDFHSPAKAEGDLRAPPSYGAYQPGKNSSDRCEIKCQIFISRFTTMRAINDVVGYDRIGESIK